MSRDRDVNAVPPVVNRTRSDGSLSDAMPWYTVDGDRGKRVCVCSSVCGWDTLPRLSQRKPSPSLCLEGTKDPPCRPIRGLGCG